MGQSLAEGSAIQLGGGGVSNTQTRVLWSGFIWDQVSVQVRVPNTDEDSVRVGRGSEGRREFGFRAEVGAQLQERNSA